MGEERRSERREQGIVRDAVLWSLFPSKTDARLAKDGWKDGFWLWDLASLATHLHTPFCRAESRAQSRSLSERCVQSNLCHWIDY